jgi:hypothetical protein
VDSETARAELTRAALDPARGKRAVIDVLAAHGGDALGFVPRPGMSLDEIVILATEARQTEARRAFAGLLVHAIGIPGLLPARGETPRLIQAFLERALLNPLRRAGYPFDGAPYEKRQALLGLHRTIEQHLLPLEPSIPRWIHGIGED